MSVYFILAADSRRVKIGFTAGTSQRRLSKMQTDNHERLAVIRWLQGNEQTEGLLQNRYAHLRLHGDWFAFCETMLGDVGVPDEPQAVRTDSSPFAQIALRRHLFENKISFPTFAETIGVSVQAVHRYVSGERVPRHEVMERIATATGGRVQPNDMHEAVAARAGAETAKAAEAKAEAA